jgi:hypothetical protein
VFSVTVRACDIAAVDDEVARTVDWLDGLRRVTHEVHHGAYDDAAARWAGLAWLNGEPDFDPRAQHLAVADARYGVPVLVWADGQRYVRVTDVERYVRGVLGQPLAVQQIGARLREVGCDQRRAEVRRPGAARTAENRVRVSVFVLPRESADAPETNVSPGSPTVNARAHAGAHASTAWGTLGTQADRPMTRGIGRSRRGSQASLSTSSRRCAMACHANRTGLRNCNSAARRDWRRPRPPATSRPPD